MSPSGHILQREHSLGPPFSWGNITWQIYEAMRGVLVPLKLCTHSGPHVFPQKFGTQLCANLYGYQNRLPVAPSWSFHLLSWNIFFPPCLQVSGILLLSSYIMLILALPLPKYSALKSFIQMDIDQVQTKSVPQNSVTWALLNPLALTLIQHLRQTLDSLT